MIMNSILNDGNFPLDFKSQFPKTLENQRLCGKRYKDEASVVMLFYENHWNLLKCSELEPKLARKIFDLAAHIGNKNAFKVLQQACKEVNKNLKSSCLEFSEDNIYKIIEQVKKINHLLLITYIRQHQWRFYARMLTKDPSLEKYRLVYRNRAFLS